MEKQIAGYPIIQSLSEFLRNPYEVKTSCCAKQQAAAGCCVSDEKATKKENDCCPQPADGSACC